MEANLNDLIDWSELGEAVKRNSPPKAGTYSCVVTNAEWVTASTGASMIKVTLAIADPGDQNGKKITDNLVFTEKAAGIFAEKVKTILGDLPVTGQTSRQELADSLIGREVQAVVGLREYDGRIFPDVKRYISSRSSGPTSPTSMPKPPSMPS